jgi:hypothetical protein
MSNDHIDHLRHGIQQLLAAATHRLEVSGTDPDQLEALTEQGTQLVRQYAVVGAVQLPGQDGDRWAWDLRREAERVRRLTRAAHLDPAAREELTGLARALAVRQEELYALRDFGTVPKLVSQSFDQETPLAGAPADPFTDFIRHQRTLLLTLWRKGKVSIKAVLRELYGTNSNDNLEALQQVIKRTNKRLATVEMVQRFEVSRRGEFLELREV